jgi:hypothetical protein
MIASMAKAATIIYLKLAVSKKLNSAAYIIIRSKAAHTAAIVYIFASGCLQK